MDYKYFGDNLIPGVNAQNLNVGVVNPLMSAGSQVGQAYGDYGKNLRQALGQGNDQYAQDFLAGKLSGQPKKLSNLGSDYKESEAAAFRGAAEAGDPQTASIKAMTAQPSVPSVNTPSTSKISNSTFLAFSITSLSIEFICSQYLVYVIIQFHFLEVH